MSTQEYTEAEAYQRLLEIAQNILSSTQTDTNILEKYQKLKSALLAKITIDPLAIQLTYTKKLLQSYKYVTGSFIEVISEFQVQIQNEMERQTYNKRVIGIVKQWELRLEELKQNLRQGANQKQKLIFKEEVSALTYYCSQLDSKLQNLGLLIEVHKKMHEIICQASKSEIEKQRKEEQLVHHLRQLQQQVDQVKNIKLFIQQHRRTQQNYKEFKMWSNKLENLLFQH